MRAIRLAISCFSLVGLLVSAAPAVAQEHGDVPAEAASPFSGKWYGWQVLLAGGAIPLTWMATRIADIDATEIDRPIGDAFFYGTLASPIGPAVVHALHGHAGRAVGSLALDVGVPALIGAAIGASEDADGNEGWFPCDFTCGFVLGFALTAPLGTIVDTVLLSWEEPGVSWDASVSVQPTLVVTGDRLGLGVGGSF